MKAICQGKMFPVGSGEGREPNWGRSWPELGKVGFEGWDLPRQNAILGPCSALRVGKVRGLKSDLPRKAQLHKK